MSFKYLQSLLMRSATVQEAIEREHRALRPNWMRLLQLKKLRLAIKDRLNRIGIAPPGTVRLAPVPLLRRRPINNMYA